MQQQKNSLFVVPTQVTMAPIAPPFADVLNSYMCHVVHECFPDPAVHEGLEKVICSYVVNLQRENTSESEIYDLLAEMNRLLGSPLTSYEKFVMRKYAIFKVVLQDSRGCDRKMRQTSVSIIKVC